MTVGEAGDDGNRRLLHSSEHGVVNFHLPRLTANCGRNTPVHVADVDDLNEFPPMNSEPSHLLESGGLQTFDVRELLGKDFLTCSYYFVIEPRILVFHEA